MTELHNWEILSLIRGEFAVGYLKNDRHAKDGTFIRTARIERLEGDLLTTRYATYRLVPAPTPPEEQQ